MANAAGSMPNDGRWGWYKDHEGNEFRRVSTLIKKVETDHWWLDAWRLRQVLEGAAVRDDVILGVKAMGRPGAAGWSKGDKKKIDELVKTAMEAAKVRDGATVGTAVHDLTERVDRGEPAMEVARGLPGAAAADLLAYAKLRELNGWRSVEIERTVVCDVPMTDEVAGTFDRIDVVPGLSELLGAGTCQYEDWSDVAHVHQGGLGDELPVIVDVKTEGDPTLNGLHIGPQLAIYSRARRMWVPGEQAGADAMLPAHYVSAPCVRQDIGIVVHVRDGRAVPLFVNLAEGWDAALAADEQQARESRAKRKMGSSGAWFVPVPNVVEPKPAEVLTDVAVIGQYADPARGAATDLGPAPAPPVLAGKVAREVGDMLSQGGVVTHVAERRADGNVTWRPEPANGTQVEVGGISFTKVDSMANVVQQGALDDVDKQAIETVWSTADLAGLARVYEIYTGTVGRTWGGRVAEAATARRAQIECVQRGTHSGTGKCACGWVAGVAA